MNHEHELRGRGRGRRRSYEFHRVMFSQREFFAISATSKTTSNFFTEGDTPRLPTLNVNIPRFYGLLRKEFLYDQQAHFGEFVKVCVFGVASITGRALGFHVLTETGAVIWRLPIHALCHHADANPRPLDWLQFWDCFSYEVSCTVFDRLADSRVRIQLRDRSWVGGQYMFTLDWYGQPDAEEAGDGGHKCAHMIALDDGNFAAQPNNRIQWLCPAFVTPFAEKPDYLTNTAIWKVERETETTSGYFYNDVHETTDPSQVQLYVKGLRVDAGKGTASSSDDEKKS